MKRILSTLSAWLLLLVAASPALAQTATLEFAAGVGNTTASGPTLGTTTGPPPSQVITFQNNVNNPNGNVFGPYSPTVTATFVLDNQQYTLPTNRMSTGTGVALGAAVNGSGIAAVATSIFPLMNTIGASTDANYSSANGINGGISTTVNRSLSLFVSSEPLVYNAPVNVRYQFADLTINFSRPILNPVIHLTGLGGTTGATPALGITAELDLVTTGVTLSKLIGSTELLVTATQIKNSDLSPTAVTGDGAASGSVLVMTPAAGITTVKFRIYLRGGTGGGQWHAQNNTTNHSGDQWLLGVSGQTPPPAAYNITNVPVPNTSTAAVLRQNLLATPNAVGGTISSYRITNLPTSGTLFYDGMVATTSTVILNLNLLSYQPSAGFVGDATFGYMAIDSNNTPSNTATYTIPVAATYALSGTIFEDVNYGGGTGRSFITANTSAVASGFATNAIGRSGATVELYDNATGLLASNVSANSTTTAANGAYSFAAVPTGSYTVRVVNSTVTSSRPGAVSTLVPVQTFRTDNGTNDGNRVGGENPAGAEGGPGTANISFNGLNGAGDNTIFIDNIEVLQGGTALATNPISNPGFEAGALTANGTTYEYTPPSNTWTYVNGAGIQSNNSAFTPPNTASGSRAGFVQGVSSISQGFTLPAGTYTLRFQAANRTAQGQQTMNVTVNGMTVLANVQATPGVYATYQTAAFTIGQQSVAPVTVGTAAITGVDFGFNFSTITNTNNAGQGSLRQFITNSNALTNVKLDQVAFNNNGNAMGADPAAGVETSIFMIGDGRTSNVPAGLRSGVNGGFVGNTATINLASALPTIIDSFTALDGSKQTTATGDNVPAVAETTTGPEVIIDYKAFAGLVATGANTYIASLGLNNANGGSYRDGAGLTFLTEASNSTVTNVTTNGNNRTGIRVEGGVANVTVSNNVLNNNSNSSTSPDADGLELLGSTLATVSGNTISNNKGYGIFMTNAANSGATISNNTIRKNGSGTSTATAGISVGLQSDNNLFLSNTITDNAGDGIVALAGAQGNRFSKNNIANNGGTNPQNLGIDLGKDMTVTGDGVSLNANGKTASSGANALLNFPVFTQATINAGRLYVSGYVKAGALVEIFVASADPSGFGEGATYSFSATEGLSGEDSDPRFASYSATSGIPTGSLNQGSETGVSQFIFSFPVDAAQITAFTTNKLTATATVLKSVNGLLVGNTSEFSAVIAVTNNKPLPVELTAFTATAKNLDAQLAWNTAQEKNNHHFDVERSLNGRDFAKIGEVRGQGSKTTPTNYAFTDGRIGAKAGSAVYYRLQQVDTDGTTILSSVRTVQFGKVMEPAISLAPNPATNGTQLDMSLLPAGRYEVLVLDATGRTVLGTSLEAGLVHTLNLSRVASGSYQVVVRGQPNGQLLNFTKRLTKE